MFLAAFTSALQVCPQAAQVKTAWLLRFSPVTCPHTEQRWLVNAGWIFSIRPGAFCSSRRTRIPHPEARIARFNPALACTLRPGSVRVPFADRVMLSTSRFSTRTPGGLTVRSSEVVCHSLREIPQCLLLDHHAPGSQPLMLGTRLSQLVAVLSKAWRVLAAGPPPGPLLDGKVPHEPRMAAMVSQHLFLRRRR